MECGTLFWLLQLSESFDIFILATFPFFFAISVCLSGSKKNILCMKKTADLTITNTSTGAESVAVPTVGHTLLCHWSVKLCQFLLECFRYELFNFLSFAHIYFTRICQAFVSVFVL